MNSTSQFSEINNTIGDVSDEQREFGTVGFHDGQNNGQDDDQNDDDNDRRNFCDGHVNFLANFDVKQFESTQSLDPDQHEALSTFTTLLNTDEPSGNGLIDLDLNSTNNDEPPPTPISDSEHSRNQVRATTEASKETQDPDDDEGDFINFA